MFFDETKSTTGDSASNICVREIHENVKLITCLKNQH